MKTERRQDLQKNELADWLESQAENLGPMVKYIVGALVLVFAVYFLVQAVGARRKAAAAEGWDVFRAAASQQDILGLRDVAEQYSGTAAAGWARQTAGDLSLATGARAMYGNRDVAMDRLKEARDDYSAALAAAKDPMLKQRSLMGLAQAHESLNEFDSAEECYNKVMKGWPDTEIAKTAQTRLNFLKQPSTKEFYDWFYEQEIELPPPIAPLEGGNIKPPSVYGDLPSNPGLKLPGTDELGSGLGSDLAPPDEAEEEAPATTE